LPKCSAELQKLDENIIEETFVLEGEPNALEYTCPWCKTELKVFVKVDMLEVMSDE